MTHNDDFYANISDEDVLYIVWS